MRQVFTKQEMIDTIEGKGAKNRIPMMYNFWTSPNVFGEFFKPYYKELIDKAHSLGTHFWLHTCGNKHYESDQFQATGGNFAKIFDVQNKKFITVSCTKCGHTELYKARSSEGWDVLDFLMG